MLWDGTELSNKRALLIGINKYHPLLGPLRGCVSDAQKLCKTLQARFSFPAENIRELYNEAATCQAIVDNLKSMVTAAMPGDVLVIFYSGHGTRLSNVEDPSGKDEAIVAYSPDWEHLLSGKKDYGVLFQDPYQDLQFIRDKNLRELLETCPHGANLTVIMDCCHSGDINRDHATYPKFIEPPDFMHSAIREALRTFWENRQTIPSDPNPDKLSWGETVYYKVLLGNRYDFVDTMERSILLAACSEKESALERVIEGRPTGIFSHYLCKTLDENSDLTHEELIRNVGDLMRFTPQMPRLACPSQLRANRVFTSLSPH